jgi:hypothetical protein
MEPIRSVGDCNLAVRHFGGDGGHQLAAALTGFCLKGFKAGSCFLGREILRKIHPLPGIFLIVKEDALETCFLSDLGDRLPVLRNLRPRGVIKQIAGLVHLHDDVVFFAGIEIFQRVQPEFHVCLSHDRSG